MISFQVLGTKYLILYFIFVNMMIMFTIFNSSDFPSYFLNLFKSFQVSDYFRTHKLSCWFYFELWKRFHFNDFLDCLFNIEKKSVFVHFIYFNLLYLIKGKDKWNGENNLMLKTALKASRVFQNKLFFLALIDAWWNRNM